MNNIDAAKAVLRYLQEQELTNQQLSYRFDRYDLFPETVRADIKNFVETMSDSLSTVDTGHEWPITYSILNQVVNEIGRNDIQEKIKSAFNINNPDDLEFPVFGTVYSKEINAEYRIPLYNTKLIVISGGILMLASDLAAIFDELLFSRTNGEIEYANFTFEDMAKQINNAPLIEQYYIDVFSSIFFYDSPIKARQVFFDCSFLSSIIMKAMHYFVVGHEYAHSICNHTGVNIKTESIDEIDFTKIMHNFDNELEADLIGAFICMSIIAKEPLFQTENPNQARYPELFFLGAYLFLCYLEQEEAIRAIKSQGATQINVTHPPAAIRKDFFIEMYFNGKKPQLYTDIDKILKKMFIAFIHVLGEAKTQFGDKKIDFYQLQKFIYKEI